MKQEINKLQTSFAKSLHNNKRHQTYEIHYDELFKGVWYHMIIVVSPWQVPIWLEKLKAGSTVKKNLDVCLNLE